MAEQAVLDPAGQAPEQAQSSPRRKPVPLIIAAVLVIVGIVLWRLFFAGSSVPASIVILSGRIEGDDSAIAPKTTGRVLEVRVREGDEVKAGDVIAVLDDQQIQDRHDQAQAALTAAEARTTSARAQVAVLEEQLKQSELTADQSKDDSQGRVRQAEADLTAAQADLTQQEASLKLALFDKDAYARLVQTGAVSERQGRLSMSTADQQEAAVSAARRRVESVRGALLTAQANLANPGIRLAQVAGVREQLIQQQAEIAVSAASAEQARFQLSEADANRQDLLVRAPFSGTVITRAAEPGEIVTAGTAIVTLLDLSKVYLRGYVPEGEIGKVKIGQSAQVYLDSNSKQPLDAYVSRIDPQATFTPENTYFRDDRVKQVVGVKLQIKAGSGYAKPGMPSDGEILVQGDKWPAHKVQ
ncbi:HlyD family secretion protein [Granulicella sp. S156]|uniref:HlyD family secretion protein n=1 Tax=Granulicella sp. S156 TaxID=1747224 RepID=UPI00131D909A|nr:HlyD family efflux transporter periplasmic adaptor subunit [Granulicella sp. S156]